MTDLKLFRLDTDGRDIELRGTTVALEMELQRRGEAGSTLWGWTRTAAR
ncbi:hypothetical protein AB0958_38825 [Streptomyces sp. NPDC006655]